MPKPLHPSWGIPFDQESPKSRLLKAEIALVFAEIRRDPAHVLLKRHAEVAEARRNYKDDSDD